MKRKLKAQVIERGLLDYLKNLPENSYLPPERKLAEDLDVSRSTLRKALETIAAQGYIHRISGKGNIVSTPAGVPGDVGSKGFIQDISLFMPSAFIAPYTSKMLAGWDDMLRKNRRCYALCGNSNPHQQLDNIRKASRAGRIMALSMVPWNRNVLSPIPELLGYKGELVFLLDRHVSYPELGYAVVNDENASVRLAMENVRSRRHCSGRIIYFHRSGTHYSSEAMRRDAVIRLASGYGLELAVVDTSYRSGKTIRDVLSSTSDHLDVMCSDAFLAKEIIMAGRESGRIFPEDISLVSLFETPSEFNVSHVHIDFYTIGQLAANLAVNILEGKSPRGKTISVEPSFCEGEL